MPSQLRLTKLTNKVKLPVPEAVISWLKAEVFPQERPGCEWKDYSAPDMLVPAQRFATSNTPAFSCCVTVMFSDGKSPSWRQQDFWLHMRVRSGCSYITDPNDQSFSVWTILSDGQRKWFGQASDVNYGVFFRFTAIRSINQLKEEPSKQQRLDITSSVADFYCNSSNLTDTVNHNRNLLRKAVSMLITREMPTAHGLHVEAERAPNAQEFRWKSTESPDSRGKYHGRWSGQVDFLVTVSYKLDSMGAEPLSEKFHAVIALVSNQTGSAIHGELRFVSERGRRSAFRFVDGEVSNLIVAMEPSLAISNGK